MNFLAERTYFDKSFLIKRPIDSLTDIHHLDLWHPFFKNPTWYSVNESVYDHIIPEQNRYAPWSIKCKLDKKTSSCYHISQFNMHNEVSFLKDEMRFTVNNDELEVSFVALPCPVRNDLKWQTATMSLLEWRWKKKEYQAKKIFRYIKEYYG